MRIPGMTDAGGRYQDVNTGGGEACKWLFMDEYKDSCDGAVGSLA